MIEVWRNILEKHFLEIEKFIRSSAPIGKEYSQTQEDVSELGFNAFALTSDLYRRENFHSDIIKALLDPAEKHNEGNKFLHLFIGMLNKISHGISRDDFQSARVVREQDRIDILITDETSKKAIIIENKINNAGDMFRQLPRYCHAIEANGYEVVAIAYITLDPAKSPDISGWNKDEADKVFGLLKPIPAYHSDDNKVNLYADWLIPSMNTSKNIDAYCVLRQYAELVKHLNTKYMDKISLEKFYETLQQNDNLKTSVSIRNMLNDLPEYLAIRIEDRYKGKSAPFRKVFRYQLRDTVFEGFELNKLYLKLDVWCSENGYDVCFWAPLNEKYDIKEGFKDDAIFESFKTKQGGIHMMGAFFNLFDEEALYKFIDDLLKFLETKSKQ